jgi:hypothetical protein
LDHYANGGKSRRGAGAGGNAQTAGQNGKTTCQYGNEASY